MAVPAIFQQTTNLIRLFLYTRGQDEVPPQFYLWAFLTTMAACVRDQVTVAQLADAPAYANLYTLLTGPPGCGKGTAIKACTRLVEHLPVVNLYEGALNGPSLFRLLHRVKNNLDPISGTKIGSKVYLVMEELGMDAGTGNEATQFIKYLTGLWKPKAGKLEKQTISGGKYQLQDVCVNWIGGTTRHWLFDVLSHRDFSAGAGRRIIAIEGRVDPTMRHTHVTIPEDRERVLEHIKYRLASFTQLRGEIKKTDAALAWEDYWYRTRPPYTSEHDIARWKQEPELMNQIGIGLVLADGGDLTMEKRHMEQALRLTQEAQIGLPTIIDAAKSMDSGLLHEVYSVIRDMPGLTWSQLVEKSGLLTFRLRGIMSTLEQGGKVYTFKGTDGKVRYASQNIFKTKNEQTAFHAPEIDEEKVK